MIHLLKRNKLLFNAKLAGALLVVFLTFACQKNNQPTPVTTPAPPDQSANVNSATVTINRSQKHQIIDGFGFFGAQSVWWDGSAANLYSEPWAKQVIEDLGITIWRNEYYPPATPSQGQDATWNKQKPVVEGLANVAKNLNVPLKFIFTVWSPPASLKCAVDANDNREPGVAHAKGTKYGGALDPNKYTEFGNWLADGIQLYKDLGVDVYAISPQNEPLFSQFFNSCFYKPAWYTQMYKASLPVVKDRFPHVKIFGSENMLEMEGGKDRQWFYHRQLMDDDDARQYLDIWAVHGYTEGVTPTTTSKMAQLWQTIKTEQVAPTNKPIWMTETSGYFDTWSGSSTKPGAMDLGLAIHAALYYGHASAWVWWQGSDMGNLNEYSLMKGTSTKSKRYYVSKHFYRFIRPNARMVAVSTNESDGVFASAFEHNQMGSFTIVLINSTNKEVKITLNGDNIPDTFDFYQTTATDNCAKKSPVNKSAITLPAQSIVTLVNGNVFE